MKIEGLGEVKQCGHCRGSGTCSCRKCETDNGYTARGLGLNGPCSTCGGVGSIWVGPRNVKINLVKNTK